jgi:hypothetical protein
MSTTHKATPEQWARLEARQLVLGNDLACAALELRSRIEALEAAAKAPPDHLHEAAGAVATNAELLKAWDVHIRWLREEVERHAYNLGRQHGAANRRAILGSSPAPDDGLVELVVDAITDSAAGYGTADEPARAAILAVAEWLDAIGYGATASILRQELQHHG